MKEIPLTRGMTAKVSDEDFDFLSQWKWCANQGHKNKNQTPKFYAKRFWWRPDQVNKKGVLYMHRVIVSERMGLEIPPGFVVDHIDNDGLNNQRENLRVLSHHDNTKHAMFKKKEEPFL